MNVLDAVGMGDVTSWVGNQYALFGNQGATNGNIGVGYNSTSGGCLSALIPNTLIKNMTFLASNHIFIVNSTPAATCVGIYTLL